MSLQPQFQGRNIVRFCGIFGLSLLSLAGCVATRPGFWNDDDLKSVSSKSDQASQVASIDDFEPLPPEQLAQSFSGHAALPDDFAQPVASEEKRNPFVDDETTAPARATADPIRQVQHTDTPAVNADPFGISAAPFANLEKPAARTSAPAVASAPAATPEAPADLLFPPDDVSPPTKSDTATASTPSIPGDDPNLPFVESTGKSTGVSSGTTAAGAGPAAAPAEPTAAAADAKVAATDPSLPPADPTPQSQTSGAEPVAANSGGVPNSTPTKVGHINKSRGVSPLFADNDASAPPAEPPSVAAVPSAPAENAPSPTVEHAASVKELEASDAWTAAPESPKQLPQSPSGQYASPQSPSAEPASQPELQPVPHSSSQSAYWTPQQSARNRALETRPESPAADVVCSSSMICDSNAVRGKFTGGTMAHSSENERARQAAASDEASAAVCSLNRNVQEWQPEAVVHAVANQVDRTTFDGPSESHLVHALAVHADQEAAIAKVSEPEPTEAAKTGPGFSTALKPAAKAPAEAPSQQPRGNSEAWFAIGLSLGLFASVMLGLRLRRKADPTLG
jgi:hypothetical protein